jgi:hypothetical protein
MRIIHHQEAFKLICPVSRQSCLCYSCVLWESAGASFGSCGLRGNESSVFRFDCDGRLLVTLEEAT